jgi:succinate dehydrogenase/fumarate reductase flavoprotein subunit
MASVLYDGQSRHGDLALVEAALSARCFFKLVNLGVPFPHDRYGQYVGYKTDHDPLQRATSCGPLTSRYMTERLELAVKNKRIPIFDGFRVVALLTADDAGSLSGRVIGLLAIDKSNPGAHHGMTLFRCTNVVYATGGPSALYYRSVFPSSQTCALGAAFLAGARGSNVTEWQFGLASTKFRWNLSGTYQQVIPRYYSTEQDGSDEREFLTDFFDTPGEMFSAVFLKGYQWPFDPRKLGKGGSSIVDMAVYRESQIRNRRVFMDFRTNPSAARRDGKFDFSLLSQDAFSYLKNSDVLFGSPLERLLKMNKPAYELYKNNGIDLAVEPLEIDVCSQHNNGGLAIDLWWQSNVKGLFPVGEACGNFGVYRPGGSALNATQVGGVRAAQYISKRSDQAPVDDDAFAREAVALVPGLLADCAALAEPGSAKQPPLALRRRYQKEMDKCAGFIRNGAAITAQIERCRGYLAAFTAQTLAQTHADLVDALINRDILVTQLVYLSAMKAYIDSGGASRGSYLIDTGGLDFDRCKAQGVLTKLDEGARAELVQEVSLTVTPAFAQGFQDSQWAHAHSSAAGSTTSLAAAEVTVTDIPRRALPADDAWFENIYNDFHHDKIIGACGG